MRSPLERFFADPVFGTGMTFGGAINAFPVEVVEEGSDIVVRCELAGLNPEDVDVRITDQGVTIRGERRAQEPTGSGACTGPSASTAPSARAVSFPVPVDSEQAAATFQHGLLEVRAPKRNPDAGPDGRRLNITPLH